MPGFPEQVYQRMGIANAIFPNNNAAGIVYTETVNCANFGRVLFLVSVGVLTGAATVQAGLQTGAIANGSDAANYSGGTIGTNIGIANQQATFEFAYGATELSGKQYVRGFINTVGNNAYVCGNIWGVDPRYSPASSFNSASVNTNLVA